MNQAVISRAAVPVVVQAGTAALGQSSLLRLITCGSVDDGKSTLIGRLLFEAGQIPDDQLAVLRSDSERRGTAVDYSLLVDGLAAEREQGITIDVAYRYFSSSRRKFIVADCPGHEQYTRNMATAASTADLAILLVDAQKGVLAQTRRHSLIVALLGVRHVILAVNKMDAIGFDAAIFAAIEAQFHRFADRLGFATISCLPVSAKGGDNILSVSCNMPWYSGPSLMACLERVEIARFEQDLPFRMPVQWVNRWEGDGRGYSGMIASGRLRRGDPIHLQPSGRRATVQRIHTPEGDFGEAVAGQSVTVILAETIDVSRGDLLAALDSPAAIGNQLTAKLLWVSQEALNPGRSYLLKAGSAIVPAVVDRLSAKVDIANGAMQPQPALQSLVLNEIGIATLTLDRRLGLDPYRDNRATGGFILIDRVSNDTVAMGMVESIVSFAATERVEDSYASMEGVAVPAPVTPPPRPALAQSRLWRFAEAAITFGCAFAVVQSPLPAAAIALATALVQFGVRRALGARPFAKSDGPGPAA
jgi:sulfate adenylyltransferase large subunit